MSGTTKQPTDLSDPLGSRSAEEPCWCGSGYEYATCHGNHEPASEPGAPLPPDDSEKIFISPTVAVARGAFARQPLGGAPITMPAGAPASVPVRYTTWDAELASTTPHGGSALSIVEVGRLRVEVLRTLASRPDTDDVVPDDVIRGVYELTAQTLSTVAELAGQQPRRTMLWNAELDIAPFMGRTLLLADHVLFPDTVFGAVLRGARSADVRKAASAQLQHAALVAAGVAVPVPEGVAMAARGQEVLQLTDRDLARPALVPWVREQLIIEGPTAREVLFFRAKDDYAKEPDGFVLHGRIDNASLDDTGGFRTRMLHPYEPDYDYQPWIRQEIDKYISKLVQRTNERVVTADVFGCEFVSASLFEARMLRRRHPQDTRHPSQAAMWANIPLLPSLSGPDLAKVLRHEGAVEDLRRQVRASLVTARSDTQSVDAITDLAHELEAASHRLAATAVRDRAWQGAVPAGLGGASLLVGAFTGGLPALTAGALGVLSGLAPYLGARLAAHRDAAYLFVAARRAHR